MGLFASIRSLFTGKNKARRHAAPVTAPRPVSRPPVEEPSTVLRPVENPATNVETVRPQVERRKRRRIDARRGTKVLIIDDSPTILAVMRKLLSSVGYVTSEALDAEAALELMRSNKPDLIFLDIILPKMDGFAALRHIRRDPETRTIPVIMMSGNELAAEQFYANRIGADDFMKKPFTRRDVFMRIEPLLDDRLIPRHIKRMQPVSPSQATA